MCTLPINVELTDVGEYSDVTSVKVLWNLDKARELRKW